MESDLVKWLLTLKPSDVTITGLILAEVVVGGWLFANEHLVWGKSHREVKADRDRLREVAETCASAKEADRDATMQLRIDLRAAQLERDWYQRQPQPQQERPS